MCCKTNKLQRWSNAASFLHQNIWRPSGLSCLAGRITRNMLILIWFQKITSSVYQWWFRKMIPIPYEEMRFKGMLVAKLLPSMVLPNISQTLALRLMSMQTDGRLEQMNLIPWARLALLFYVTAFLKIQTFIYPRSSEKVSHHVTVSKPARHLVPARDTRANSG